MEKYYKFISYALWILLRNIGNIPFVRSLLYGLQTQCNKTTIKMKLEPLLIFNDIYKDIYIIADGTIIQYAVVKDLKAIEQSC